MKKIGVIGLGLIGGSIAKALKYKANYDIVAMSRNGQVLESAMAEGVISGCSASDFGIFAGCEAVFICVPVDKITEHTDELIPYVGKNCIITDVGSTKGKIARALSGRNDITFIGGHPMAGSEKSGYASSSEFIFENAFYILTPKPDENEENLNRLKRIVKLMGAIPIVLDAEYHDKVVASISHGPHVIAAVLVNLIRQEDDEKGSMHTLSAGGFKDITRIASSDPALWQQISIDNKDEILDFINNFKEWLDDFEQLLSSENSGEIFAFFNGAKDYRNSFAQSMASFAEVCEVYTDIIDKPGSIATIATMLSVNNINIKNIGIVNNREHQEGVLHIMVENKEDKLRTVDLLKSINFKVYE